MIVPINLTRTPISFWEFCEISEITPSQYHKDQEQGLISKTCAPFDRFDTKFHFSNILDLVAYKTAKQVTQRGYSVQVARDLTEMLVEAILLANDKAQLSCHPLPLAEQVLSYMHLEDANQLLRSNRCGPDESLDAVCNSLCYFAEQFCKTSRALSILLGWSKNAGKTQNCVISSCFNFFDDDAADSLRS